MKYDQITPQERWQDNKERCKEVMSATIAELTGSADTMARGLCDEMAETGIMNFEGVASAMQPDGEVDFDNPYTSRIMNFLQSKGFNEPEANSIVTAICEFAASTMLMEGPKNN
ncbi:MAG: hypothetical protein IPL49_19375 [Saprospirales bacterium]|nr:hypothetical protein [Saprospirales bacterium]MBK8492982.1 hypothetical protein [Saprospirales bacterium]